MDARPVAFACGWEWHELCPKCRTEHPEARTDKACGFCSGQVLRNQGRTEDGRAWDEPQEGD